MPAPITVSTASVVASVSPVQRLARYTRPGTLRLSTLPPLALYVHLPWCLKKCPYCDFNSHEVRGNSHDARSNSPDARGEIPEERYVDALIADLEASLPYVWGRRVFSVFVGGGTPSLFSPAAIDRLLAGVRARVPLEAGAEITLEANPGTFERERFRAFRDAGVTRLSIGVQSFDDAKLAALGRVHDARQARAAIDEARDAFDTFNIDLMYALPGQTLAEFERDMREALGSGAPHLSIYHLTIEPNTLFAARPPSGPLALPDDDLASEMLDRVLLETSAAGLERYEVSAFARAGHRAQHNLNYWQFGDYLGLGAGAHSKLSFPHRVVRQVRFRDPARYLAAVEPGDFVASDAEVARDELAFEFMLNALRLAEGFPITRFVERTGLPLSAIEAPLAEAERLALIERSLVHVKPTPRGLDFLSDLQALFLPPPSSRQHRSDREKPLV